MRRSQNSGNEDAPFFLMRVDVSFEVAPEKVAEIERVVGTCVEHADVQTEIMTCDYQDGQFALELCYFSTDGSYRHELAWLHKAVQSVLVPVPVFTVQIRKD